MLTVIGLTGRKQNGKSTLYKLIENNVDLENGPVIVRYSFAQPLKAICHLLFGGSADYWYGDLKEEVLHPWNLTPRHIMQKVGTELFRNNFGEDFWIKTAKMHIERVTDFEKSRDVCIIIDDVRFDNEAQMVKELGGNVYEVIRGNGPVILDNHASEQGISPDLIDACMVADTLEELEINARFIAKENGLCLLTTP
jgi:hypothetical protein